MLTGTQIMIGYTTWKVDTFHLFSCKLWPNGQTTCFPQAKVVSKNAEWNDVNHSIPSIVSAWKTIKKCHVLLLLTLMTTSHKKKHSMCLPWFVFLTFFVDSQVVERTSNLQLILADLLGSSFSRSRGFHLRWEDPLEGFKRKTLSNGKKKTSHVKPSLCRTFYFIAPENGWLEDDPASFWEGVFSGALIIFGRVNPWWIEIPI